MSITNCRHCRRTYFRYWRTQIPPDAFCSLPCYDERHNPRPSTEPAPKFPDAVLRDIRWHRGIAHQTTSLLRDFECEECDRLEALYSESLHYHLQALTSETLWATNRGLQ